MQHETAMHSYLVGELASVGALLGTLMGFLPSIATLFAVIWYSVLLYDRLIARRLKSALAEIPDTGKDTD